MEGCKCPYCGTDLSTGMLAIAPTNLYGEDYRYVMCRECYNFLLLKLKNFRFYKLPNRKAEYDAIKEFDKIIKTDLAEDELNLIDLLKDVAKTQNKLH
jgi:hypothetical protein